MNTQTTCPQCGTELPANTVRGLCPKCLALVAMESGSEDKTLILQPPAEGTVHAALNSTLNYFGDYELLEEIARGGMGVVFKARQVRLNRTVAVKMILSGQLAGEAEVKRFHTEAEAAANLQHPNIVAIHEVGEHEGRHYFSMDYIEGENLAEFLKKNPLPATQAAQWMKTIAEAIHFAHQRGTLHRDLKPHNILIDRNGQPHVTDFGLAKRIETDSGLTQSGAVMGSPAYMPPEQATGRNAEFGPASDVYSLGAILYQMLTGKAPFSGASAIDTLRQVVEQEPIAPSKINDNNPADLETICLKCLEKKPEQRYSSARALAEELERFLKHEPILAKPASMARKVTSWALRHPWAITGVASLAIVALLGLAFGLWQRTMLLEWDKAHPGQQHEAWPASINSASLLFLLFIPFVLSLVFLCDNNFKCSASRNRFVPMFYGLAGGMSVFSGIYLGLNYIRLFVWDKHVGWGSLLSGTTLFVIPFVWAGSTLLWHVAWHHYVRKTGFGTSELRPKARGKLGKVFWYVLLGECAVFFLLSYWFVGAGKFQSPYPGATASMAADWERFMRIAFQVWSLWFALIPFLFFMGICRRGNQRWGFIFSSIVLLLLGSLPAGPAELRVPAIIAGLVGGALLIAAARKSLRSQKILLPDKSF